MLNGESGRLYNSVLCIFSIHKVAQIAGPSGADQNAPCPQSVEYIPLTGTRVKANGGPPVTRNRPQPSVVRLNVEIAGVGTELVGEF